MTLLPGARKDAQIVTGSWQKIRTPIEGVVVHEVLHMPGNRGVLTEIFRPEWHPGGEPVAQIFQIRMFPGALNAWHCHQGGTDRLFVARGHARIALFDARDGSPTRGVVNELHVGEARPTLVIVPPGVWHGVQNLGGEDLLLVNSPTVAYDYEDPDHYRLPPDTPEIPFSWALDEGGPPPGGERPR